MIYTVTCNPSLDYIMNLDPLEEGGCNRAKGATYLPGGKGINVSIVLSRLGMESVILGFIAGFTGKEIERRLEAEGLRPALIPLSCGESRINVKVKADNMTEINAKGPIVDKAAQYQLLATLSNCSENDMVILAGSLAAGMEEDFYLQICKLLASNHTPFIVDAEKKGLQQVLECHPFLIKPNHIELMDFFGLKSWESPEQMVEYGKKLQDLGARNVLISRGKDGAILMGEDGEVTIKKAPEGAVVNPVGAGDSMVAGFVYGYLTTHDLSESLNYGLAAGSASACSENLCTKEEMENFLRRA